MATQLTDTSPEVERIQIAGLRAMPLWRKLKMASDLTAAARAFAFAGLRERYPGAGAEELRRRLATLVLGPELATKVYGAEPGPPTMR